MASSARSTRYRRRLAGVVAAVAVGFPLVATAAPAVAEPVANPDPVPADIATFPGLGDCAADAPACLSVVVRDGLFDINGFQVPVTDGSLVISGALDSTGLGLAPSTAANFGVVSKPLTIPGGVLGVDLPFNNLFGLTAASAQVEAVAPPTLDLMTSDLVLKVRLKVINPLVGDSCYIGSSSFPVTLNLKGQAGLFELINQAVVGADIPGLPAGWDTIGLPGVQNTATAFPLPPSQGCGPFGVLGPIVDFRSHVPSDGTGTSLTSTSDAFLTSGIRP